MSASGEGKKGGNQNAIVRGRKGEAAVVSGTGYGLRGDGERLARRLQRDQQKKMWGTKERKRCKIRHEW